MNVRKFVYTENRITATLIDGYYLWIAYLGTNNICHLAKNSAFDPSINYFTINIVANKINRMWQNSTILYLALDDATNSGCTLNKQNPINSQLYQAKQIGITEESIDVIVDPIPYTYLLVPGNLSGTNAKVLKYFSSAFVTTIDLTTITNADKIDIDNAGNLWVVTNTTPVKLVKIYKTGLVYNYTSYNLV